MSDSAYQKLKNHLTMIGDLGKAASILSWEREAMMPPHANEERSKVMATLGTLIHEKATIPEMKDWIAQAVQEVSDPWDVRNMELIHENYVLETSLPTDLVYALEEAQGKCVTIWRNAKQENDWKKTAPALGELFALVKEKTAIYGELLNCDPYDAILSRNARGNRRETIDPLFTHLRHELPPLVQAIAERQKNSGGSLKNFKIPIAAQKEIGRDLAQQLGYSFERGRLDTTTHPFSGGTAQDSRITTRYSEENPFSSLDGIIHETGHALYSQNLPVNWDSQPIGSDSDMSIHESQSLIMEKQAGLNPGFLKFLYQFIATRDPGFAAQGDAKDFTNVMHHVSPSYIRVEADEATYPLHIVLRYEIEKKLFAGEIAIDHIPELWNSSFKELFGLDVPNYAQGCMQDIHWFWGLYGYFPTYTQGALYAAQLFDAMKRDLPHVENDLARGDFGNFQRWLNEKVHNWGQFYDAPDLIEHATGAKPDAKYFIQHLKNRYLTSQ
jgi:carboxypeptidase Taq